MSQDFYQIPSDPSLIRQMRANVPAIPAGYLLKALDWPKGATDEGLATLLPDGEAPDLVAEEALDDTRPRKTTFPTGTRRLRAGDKIAAKVPVRSKGGKLIPAQAGDTYFYESKTESKGEDDLFLADWVGRRTMG